MVGDPYSHFRPDDLANVDLDNSDEDPDREPREETPVPEGYDNTNDIHILCGGGSPRRPHHLTTYRCPVSKILPRKDIDLLMYQPHNAFIRFRPLPLPPFVNANRGETRVSTITPVRPSFVHLTDFQRPLASRSESLSLAINRVSRFPGATELDMAPYSLNGEDRILVRRRTVFQGQSTGRLGGRKETQDYSFTLFEWCIMDVGVVNPHLLWWQNLNELSSMASDRAYHEVRRRVEMHEPSLQPWPRLSGSKIVSPGRLVKIFLTRYRCRCCWNCCHRTNEPAWCATMNTTSTIIEL